jgi:AcrR family transcriptional regulator
MKTKKNNRREIILNVAARLFLESGYTATSIRHIAESVGCTEAAIYYHFKDGKRELLRVVAERRMSGLMIALNSSRGASSLADFIVRFGNELAEGRVERAKILRWIAAELPLFNADEIALHQQLYLVFHREVAAEVERFVADKDEVDRLSWLLICVLLGYADLFLNLGMEARLNYVPQDLIGILANALP